MIDVCLGLQCVRGNGEDRASVAVEVRAALQREMKVLQREVNPRRPWRNGGVRRRKPSAVLGLPSLALYSVFVIYPTVATVYYSFTNWDGFGKQSRFIGLANFRAVLASPLEREALINTIEATVGIVVCANVLGLVIALLLQRGSRLNHLLRLLWFLPAALPSIVAGYIWTFIYSPDGPIAAIWHAFDPTATPPGFIGDPHQALASVAAIAIWQQSGYAMVVLLAGLKAIDPQIQEAATIDGVGRMQRLRYVIMPLLRPAFAVSVVLTAVSGFLLFDAVMATTDGGPGYATETLATQLYKQAFLFNDFGFGMAMGVLIALLILVVSGILLWSLNRKEALA